MKPICPNCNIPMVLRWTDKYTYKDGSSRPFYGCPNFPKCREAHGAHPDGSPMGSPADKETRQARQQAHAAFDNLWKGESRKMTRKQAYQWLQKVTGLPEKEAHIALFDQEMCQLVVREALQTGMTALKSSR